MNSAKHNFIFFYIVEENKLHVFSIEYQSFPFPAALFQTEPVHLSNLRDFFNSFAPVAISLASLSGHPSIFSPEGLPRGPNQIYSWKHHIQICWKRGFPSSGKPTITIGTGNFLLMYTQVAFENQNSVSHLKFLMTASFYKDHWCRILVRDT